MRRAAANEKRHQMVFVMFSCSGGGGGQCAPLSFCPSKHTGTTATPQQRASAAAQPTAGERLLRRRRCIKRTAHTDGDDQSHCSRLVVSNSVARRRIHGVVNPSSRIPISDSLCSRAILQLNNAHHAVPVFVSLLLLNPETKNRFKL